MTKKDLVSKIQNKLEELGVHENGCEDIFSISNVVWVSYKKVLKRKPIGGSCYKLYRVNLYSKHNSLDDLWAIYNELCKKEATQYNI